MICNKLSINPVTPKYIFMVRGSVTTPDYRYKHILMTRDSKIYVAESTAFDKLVTLPTLIKIN
jgi:hypothetical protein